MIIGGTGMLGRPVARRLKDHFKIRLLVRDLEKSRNLLGKGFEYFHGDLFDQNSLDRAMKQCGGVHINLAGEVGQEGTEMIVRMAIKNEIKRITYISGTSVSKETAWFPLEKHKYYAEEAIISSGIPYTIFCPTWFMESLPKFVKDKKVFVFGRQPNLYHFIAAEDYAEMVLVAYQKKEAENKRFIIHGTNGYLFKEALEMYIRINHPTIKSVQVIPYWRAKIISILTRNKKMKQVAEFMEFFEKVGELGNPQEAWEILGKPVISLERWIEMQKKNWV